MESGTDRVAAVFEPDRSPSVAFFVPGTPRPGGSKRAFYNQRTGRAMLVDAGKYTMDWRQTVAAFAIDSWKKKPMTGPIHLAITFVMRRPKSHYGKRNGVEYLKKEAPLYHTSKPDALKLTRAVEDALTGIVWRDDAQIALESICKVYGENTGAHIKVYRE